MKLVYFNGKGFAETSRLIFAYANEEYEDFRYPLQIIDWKTHNMKKEEFDNDKANGKLKRSLNKLPYLEIDGEVIPQSKAIERYLASRFNLMGSSDVDGARIDGICEYVRDFKDAYQAVRRLQEGEERESGMKNWFSETLPSKLSDLEYILGDDGFSVGGRTSLADIVLFSFLTQFFDDTESARSAYSKCEKLTRIIENVQNNENIKRWLENRPSGSF
jgi:glutathione S-transferase